MELSLLSQIKKNFFFCLKMKYNNKIIFIQTFQLPEIYIFILLYIYKFQNVVLKFRQSLNSSN